MANVTKGGATITGSSDVQAIENGTTSSEPNTSTSPTPPTSKTTHTQLLKTLSCAPWLSLLSAAGVFAILGAVTYVLQLANDSPTIIWPWRNGFTPNVAISVCAVAVNTLLRHVLSEGSIISWWLTAQEGATLQDLHWNWEMRTVTGIFRVILARSRMNSKRVRWVAVGTLIVTLTSAHGVLLQRAIKFHPRVHANDGDVDSTYLRARLPDEFFHIRTGIPTGSGSESGIIPTTLLTDTMYRLDRDDGFVFYEETEEDAYIIDARNCPTDAECVCVLRGVGLKVLTSTTQTYEYTNPPPGVFGYVGTMLDSNASGPTAGVGFMVKFTKGDSAQGTGSGNGLFTLDVLYKEEKGCGSLGYHRRFVFVPAVVSYLISIVDTGREPRALFNMYRSNVTAEVDARNRVQKFTDKRLVHILPAIFAAEDIQSYLDDASDIYQRGSGNATKDLIYWENELADWDNQDPEYKYLRKHESGWKPADPISNFDDDPSLYGGILPALISRYDSYAVFRPANDSHNSAFQMFGTMAQSRTREPWTVREEFIDSEACEKNCGLLLKTQPDIDKCKSNCNSKQSIPDACDTTWDDPSREIFEFIERLMFSLAMTETIVNHERDSGGEAPLERVQATVTHYGPVYDIDIKYAIAGLIIPVIAIFLLIPTYFGFWKLNTKYTGSPVEVAEAFDQSGRIFHKCNGEDASVRNIDDTLKQAHPGKLKYKKVDVGWAIDIADLTLAEG
ncbi:hypothetical protein DFH27DRAFT_530244 [Peziza echinospora]|nr:hypothetical protein DFH27DRAFT_530244 [Peziza echinospora]